MSVCLCVHEHGNVLGRLKTGTATATAATAALARWIESLLLLLLCGGGKSQSHTAGW